MRIKLYSIYILYALTYKIYPKIENKAVFVIIGNGVQSLV